MNNPKYYFISFTNGSVLDNENPDVYNLLIDIHPLKWQIDHRYKSTNLPYDSCSLISWIEITREEFKEFMIHGFNDY